jgi:hypothetical protein
MNTPGTEQQTGSHKQPKHNQKPTTVEDLKKLRMSELANDYVKQEQQLARFVRSLKRSFRRTF